MSRWTREEYQAHLKKQMQAKPSKYKAVKTVVDGIMFDSKKEAQRWHELQLLLKAKRIRKLERQKSYPLSVRAIDAPVSVIIGHYRCDFWYEEDTGFDEVCHSWKEVAEDVKGVKTAIYQWKKKHMAAQYGITIRET